jgi:TolA-binding protein
LAKADLASFERHAATCEACQREIAAFAELKRLGRGLPMLSSTPLERRRLRNELLRRAHGDHERAPRRPLAWFLSGALALALVGAAGAALLTPWASDAPAAASAAPSSEPTYRAIASSDTAWGTHQHGRDLRLTLDRGRLELAVDPLRADQRLVVELPDGELEVKGTRFVIEADGVRTRAIRVLEGRVVLRLFDRAPSLLAAGDAYVAPSSHAAPAPPIDAAAPRQTATTRRSASTSERTTRAAARDAPVPEGAEAADPMPTESAFSQAMSAFSAGDYGRADELFADFEREHPDDARVEDALFLRAVARSRRADVSGARAIARQYLERFPNGLRRDDAQRLSR